MLRVHFLQQWRSLSDLAMEEALFDVPLYREFAQLDAYRRLLDKSTILRFRHRLETHKLADGILATVNDLLSRQGLLLKEGSAVAARLIAAPSSTKNKDGKRKNLDKANIPIDALMDKIEKCKASIRAKVKRPFRLNQAPVWLREGALPGPEETHTAAQSPVCAVPACGWHATT